MKITPESTKKIDALVAALKSANEMCEYALKKFDWGNSALDAKAIQQLNETPGKIQKALREAGEL